VGVGAASLRAGGQIYTMNDDIASIALAGQVPAA